MTARSESLLWIQVLGLAALPAEALLLFLVLAGSDPGPWPGVERLLCWSLGVLAPSALFWLSPPDIWSLLMVQIPRRGRRALQQHLSALQSPLPVKLLGAGGGLMLLPALWWLDASAGLAADGSPFDGASRLLSLLLAAALLALILWQWHQMVQALWLLTCSPDETGSQLLEGERLSLGLPLLLPEQLRFETRSVDARPESSPDRVDVPVAPEQEPEQEQGPDLNQQIT